MARFNETVGIQNQNLSTGAAQGISSLADRLEGFKNTVGNIQTRIGTEQGQAQAAEAPIETIMVEGQEVAKAPDKRKTGIKDILLFNGSETQSYNQTLRAGYLASLSNDNREAVTNIANENPDNIPAFNEAMEGYTSGVLSGVEPALRPTVAAQLDSMTTDARLKVQAASQARSAAEANAQVDSALGALADTGIRAVRDGNQVAAAEAGIQYAEFVQTMVGSGRITQPAADLMIENNLKTMAAENMVTAIRTEAQTEGGVQRSAEALLTFKDRSITGFTVDEQDAIYETMVSELSDVLSLRNKAETDEAESVTAVQDATSADMFVGVIEGEITPSDITLAIANKDITQSQGSTLLNVLQTRGSGIDNYPLINLITEDIRNSEDPQRIRQTIEANAGNSLTAETSLELTSLLNQSLDSESVLNTSRTRRAESFIVQSMRVTGPFGALDSEAEKRLADAKRDFSEAVLSGEDPWVVADTLVDKDAFTRAPNPMFGSKEDLQGALNSLDAAFDAGSISDTDYDFQYNQLQDLIEMKTNLDNFENARKGATGGR